MTHFTQGLKHRSKNTFFKTKDINKSERDHRQRKSNKIYLLQRNSIIYCQKPLYVLVQKSSAVFEVKVFDVKVQQIVA